MIADRINRKLMLSRRLTIQASKIFIIHFELVKLIYQRLQLNSTIGTHS